MKLALALALLSALTFHSARADDDTPDNNKDAVDKLVALCGTDLVQQDQKVGQTHTINMDESLILDNLHTFQDMNLIRPDLNNGYVSEHSVLVATPLSEILAVLIIRSDFSTGVLGRETFVVNLKSSDEYGQLSSHELYRFSFDKATYAKINWDNFKTTNLEKVSRGFRLSPWLQHQMDQLLDN